MQFSTTSKVKRIPFILLLALIIVSLPNAPLFQPFGYDREIFRYAGMLITKGYLPYRDIFDHKPPVIYFISALAYLFGPWGFWVVSNTLTYITALVILKYARRRFTSYAFTIIVPLIYIFICRYEPIYEGGGLTREFTQLLATLIIFLRPQNQRLRFFVIGLLFALIFFTQQNDILSITVVTAYFILWNTDEKKFKKFSTLFSHGLIFMAGVFTVCTIIGGYLYFTNTFQLFIEQAFLFNTKFYVQTSYYKAFQETWMLGYYVFPNFVLFALLYITFAKWNKNFVEYIVFFIALFVQLCASSLGYHFGHYYLSFIPYFCYSIFFALTHFEDKVGAEYRRIVACAAFFLLYFPMPIIQRYQALADNLFWPYYNQRSECYDVVKDIKGKDGQLFVINSPAYLALNTDLNVASQIKLVFFHFYDNPNFDADNKMFYDMVATLRKNRCKYIIDFTAFTPIGRPELQNYWNEFIKGYHVKYENTGRYRVLEIN